MLGLDLEPTLQKAADLLSEPFVQHYMAQCHFPMWNQLLEIRLIYMLQCAMHHLWLHVSNPIGSIIFFCLNIKLVWFEVWPPGLELSNWRHGMDAMLYHRIIFMVVWVGKTYYNYYNLFFFPFFLGSYLLENISAWPLGHKNWNSRTGGGPNNTVIKYNNIVVVFARSVFL